MKAQEIQRAPKQQDTPAAGMTMGALETLERLLEYLDGAET